jgi:hypothetical protein
MQQLFLVGHVAMHARIECGGLLEVHKDLGSNLGPLFRSAKLRELSLNTLRHSHSTIFIWALTRPRRVRPSQATCRFRVLKPLSEPPLSRPARGIQAYASMNASDSGTFQVLATKRATQLGWPCFL